MAMFIKCQCSDCSAEGTVKLSLKSRGGRSAYLCSFHAEHLEGYNTESTAERGLKKVNPFTFGMELETSSSTIENRIELCGLGFIPTSDVTCNVEYKSSIWQGLNSPIKTFKSIEVMMGEGLEMDDDCGTHFHVGHRNYQPETVREFYHELFDELGKLTEANPAAARAVWGRSFLDTDWAYPTHRIHNALDHCSMVNLQHSYSLEFRLAKFRNAEQYSNVARLCKGIMGAVMNNFVEHYYDNDFDTSRYPAVRYYRKHKAQVAGKKIAKLYIKACAEAGYIL